MSSDGIFDILKHRKKWVWFCVFVVATYLIVDGYIECEQLLKYGGFERCVEQSVLKIYEFSAILAIVLLGVLLSLGLPRQQRSGS